MMRSSIFLGVIFLAILLGFSSLFVIREWDQALIVELGKPIRTIQEPGLYFKKPLLQEVVRFEKRVLEYDATARELITIDKQQVKVDNYSRWRIQDPLLFFQTVRSEAGAQSRLDDIIYSSVREKVGKVTLKELISGKRSELMGEIYEASKKKALEYGIDIIDVRIKRADLPEKNSQNVFARMRAERERQAKKYRAEGDEEAQIIRSEADKEARIIEANGKKEAEIIRGEGDAESTKIYASAYNRDPEFYAFVRALESYQKVFEKGETKILLSPEDEFLKTFFGRK